MRKGLLCRMDKTGLGQGQTLRLARLLNPDKVMLIDSTPFSGNKQYPEWYEDYEKYPVYGFPSDVDVHNFIKDLDVVISCETLYHNRFVEIARKYGVKTVLIANYEFFDWHLPTWKGKPLPDKIVLPSQWHWEEMKRYSPKYLPTPIFDDEFASARQTNYQRNEKKKFLFMNGKSAVHDRNGLYSLYEALPLAKGDFTVTIKAQNDIARHPDPRIIYDFSNPDNQEELYEDFDALILPRRYGGQALAMNEALSAGLPVIMTDIDPNYRVLPRDWLVHATKREDFMTRTMIGIYEANTKALAEKLDTIEVGRGAKIWAYELSKRFNAEYLRPQYKELLSSL